MTELMHLPKKSLLERAADLWWLMAMCPILLLLVPSAHGVDPKPLAIASADPTAWASNPQLALQAVLADNQKLMQVVQELIDAKKTDWLGWAVGAAGLLVGFIKVFNGPAGALAEGLWAGIAPKIVKDAEKKRDVMADGFLKVAEIMRSFPADTPLGQVIDKLDRRLPEAVKHVYREWEAHEADDRPDPGIVDTLVKSTPSPSTGV